MGLVQGHGYPPLPHKCRRVRKLLKTKERILRFGPLECANRLSGSKDRGVELGGFWTVRFEAGRVWILVQSSLRTRRSGGEEAGRRCAMANTGEYSTGNINLLSILQGTVEIRGWMEVDLVDAAGARKCKMFIELLVTASRSPSGLSRRRLRPLG